MGRRRISRFARRLSQSAAVTPPAVTQFADRHSADLDAMRAEIVRQVEDYAIAQKVNRIASLDALHGEIEEWLAEHTLTERSVRYDKDGNEVGETLRFRGDAVNALRGVLKDAADEMGQLPQRAGDTYNIDKAIIVREYSGFAPSEVE